VTATRTGAWALASLSSTDSPAAATASFRASASQGTVSNDAIAASSTAAAVGVPMTLSHEALSSGAPAENRKSTWLGTSPRTFTRSCTSGAIARNTSGSNASAGHGAEGPSTQGAHAATNSSTVSARMYSPLNACSFFTSKKAGDDVTSAMENSARICSQGTISTSPLGAQPRHMK
jgi:hypothetical protein